MALATEYRIGVEEHRGFASRADLLHLVLMHGDAEGVLAELVGRWRAERSERRARRHLDPADVAALSDAGLFEAPVPVALGGRWEGPTSARPLCETFRMLAGGDPSVALVTVMHPTVLAWWLHTETEDQPAWEEQRAAVLSSAILGRQWGTIASEPGSGGDMLRTRTIAEPIAAEQGELPGRCYRLTGDKHFGSGFGVSPTTDDHDRGCRRERPARLLRTRRARPTVGRHRAASRVIAEWDGMGMAGDPEPRDAPRRRRRRSVWRGMARQ